MRRVAIVNQKGGVGKTTTVANLGAALARNGRRVVVVDMDPQANLTLHLGVEGAEIASTYSVLSGEATLAEALTETATPNLRLVPSHIDLAGAELELAGAFGRETILAEAIAAWERELGEAPADYLIVDCPPSLGLLSINGLTAAREVVIALQTEFFALQGMSKLVSVIDLLRRRIQPELELTGILACLYDGRLKLARQVLAEIRAYFPGKVYRSTIHTNVRLAEAPSYGRTIFEYSPASRGARDHQALALEVIAQEQRDGPHPAPVTAAEGGLAEVDVPRPAAAATGAGIRVAREAEGGCADTPGQPEAARNDGSSARAPLPAYDYGHYLGEDRPEPCGRRGPRSLD